MEDLKKKIRSIILALFGALIVVLLIRVAFTVVNVNQTTPIVKFWFTNSEFLILPFKNGFQTFVLEGLRIETAALVAILVLFLSAYLVSKLITSFFNHEPQQLLKDIVDALFKFAEFLLLFRFFFKILAASDVAPFVDFIYTSSEFFYAPFQNILPGFYLVQGRGNFFETSTLVAIILIIIFDIISENILNKLFEKSNKSQEEPYPVSSNNGYGTQPVIHNVTNIGRDYPLTTDQGYTPAPPQQQQPNIVINMPPQQPYQEHREYQNMNTYDQYNNNNYKIPSSGQYMSNLPEPPPEYQNNNLKGRTNR